MDRPSTILILAMSADGKIADVSRSPARFASVADKAHLEKQIAQCDGVLFGANTLRAYGTTLPVSNPQLLHDRSLQSLSPQPIHIVCSARADIDSDLPFFSQPVPRWLLTTARGAKKNLVAKFDQVLIAENTEEKIDWLSAFAQLSLFGIKKLAILGGGKLVSSLLVENLIDEFWLTLCPLILGGENAPTPVEGDGFLASGAQRLELLSLKRVEQEVFLHYRLLRQEN